MNFQNKFVLNLVRISIDSCTYIIFIIDGGGRLDFFPYHLPKYGQN